MDENEVVDAVCAHLERKGFTVTQRRSTTEHGVDIKAVHDTDGRQLLIEAKGGTSSRKGSNRFGKPYTQSQVFDRCSKGIFTALRLRAQEPPATTTAVLAVPDTARFRQYLREVVGFLRPLGIEVWLVTPSRRVRLLK